MGIEKHDNYILYFYCHNPVFHINNKNENKTAKNLCFNRAYNQHIILFCFFYVNFFSPKNDTMVVTIGILCVADCILSFLEYQKNKKSLLNLVRSGYMRFNGDNSYLVL